MYYTDSIAQNVFEKCIKNSMISDEITCGIASKLCKKEDAEMSKISCESKLCNLIKYEVYLQK